MRQCGAAAVQIYPHPRKFGKEGLTEGCVTFKNPTSGTAAGNRYFPVDLPKLSSRGPRFLRAETILTRHMVYRLDFENSSFNLYFVPAQGTRPTLAISQSILTLVSGRESEIWLP